MPYIRVRCNRPLSVETEESLKAALGDAITLFPGKTERWLMVDIQENAHLWFAGESDRPLAFIEVALLGKATKDACEAMTARLCEEMQKLAGIPGDGVYVKYEEVTLWGYDGKLF